MCSSTLHHLLLFVHHVVAEKYKSSYVFYLLPIGSILYLSLPPRVLHFCPLMPFNFLPPLAFGLIYFVDIISNLSHPEIVIYIYISAFYLPYQWCKNLFSFFSYYVHKYL
jgi:hypothetical protein